MAAQTLRREAYEGARIAPGKSDHTEVVVAGLSPVGASASFSELLQQSTLTSRLNSSNIALGYGYSGLAEVFFARTLHGIVRPMSTYVESAALLAGPTPNLALRTAERDFRSQQGTLFAYDRDVQTFGNRLNGFLTGLAGLRTSLQTIEALAADTVSNPGNAAANQAAIDAIVPQLRTQIQVLRNAQAQPTFHFENLDPRVYDLALFAANGLRIDPSSFPIDINITQDARRAEAFNFLNNLAGLSQPLTFTITGPGGTSALIDVSPTGAEIVDAITGVSAANTTSVDFDITGALGSVTITILGNQPGEIADAITGINPALNTGDAVFRIGSNLQAASGATEVTVFGGTRAQILGALSAITPSGNTGGVTFELSGALTTVLGLSAETITISGGTRADLVDGVTVSPTLNTGDATISISGIDGTANVTILGGTQASAAGVLNTFLQVGNTGDRTYDITGALGTASVRIDGGSGPETGAIITDPNGDGTFVITGNTDFTLQLAGSGSAPANGTKTLNFSAGTYTQAQLIAILQADIDSGSAPLKNRVIAVAIGTTGIGFTTVAADTGPGVSLTYSQGSDPDGVLIDAAGPFVGTNGDDATAAAARVNAVSGTTGVYAVVNGTVVDFFSGTSAANRFYGSGATIVVSNIAGGNAGVVNATNTAGTNGDSAATAIGKINAVQATTGVLAFAGSGANDISLSSTRPGSIDVLGSNAEVTVADVSGGTAAATTNSSAFGTDGDSQATIINTINAVSANTGVEAFADGANIGLRSGVFGVTGLYGSDADIVIANVTGGNAVTVAAASASGTDGDTVTDVINAIAAASGGTGVTGSAGSAGAVTLTGSTGGSTEFITIQSMSAPALVSGIGIQSPSATDFGEDPEDRDDILVKINAQSGTTGVQAIAGSNANAITLQSTMAGGGATVTISNIVDPLPAAEVEFSPTLTDTGFTPTQAAVVNLINAAANSIGVEAYADADVSLRTFLYGSDAEFTINPVADPAGILGGGVSRTGTDAAGTISVDGSTPVPITATVNRFDFLINGVQGSFSVPADSIFDPASIDVMETTSQYIGLTNELGNDLSRFNFNTLNQGFLGTLLDDDLNLQTRGTNGNPGISIPLGGVRSIDLTAPTGAQAAVLMASQALDQLEADETLAQNLLNRLLGPISDGNAFRDTSFSLNREDLIDLETAINSYAQLRAAATNDLASGLLAQIAGLYNTSALPMLTGI